MTLFVSKNGRQLGPYSMAEVQNLVATGAVVASDWAWYEGLPNWIRLNQVPGFVLPITTFAAVHQPSQQERAERPPLVWVILAYFCLRAGMVIYSLTFFLIRFHGAPLSDPTSPAAIQFIVSYILVGVIMLGNLTAAGLLCMLRSSALYLFVAAFLASLAVLGYHITAHNWLGMVGARGLAFVLISIGINLAIIGYVWSLTKKGILR